MALWRCNLFQFFHHKSETGTDPFVEQDVWASKVIDFSISNGQNYVAPTNDNIMSTAGGILVQSDSYGTTAVAQSFLSKTDNKPYGLLHYGSHGEEVPGRMNFWVTVNLTYFLRYSWGTINETIQNVTFGRDSNFDWWIISPNCDWYSDKYRVYFHCDVDISDKYSSLKIFVLPYSQNGKVQNNQVVVCPKGVYCEFPDQQGSF